MSKLYLLMGIPGSGKSTWVQNHYSTNQIIVSRDDIRFSLVQENEEYFSKEKQVFNEFIDFINYNLEKGYDVFADATHISKAGRNKVLSRITASPNEVGIIWVNKGLSKVLDQNELRAGTRAYVPRSVITRMHEQLEKPEFEEGFDVIYEVTEEGITERRLK